MKDFRKLKVWHKAHELVLSVYRATAGFPSEERYGLTSQLRRASVSIPANLAEGCGRHTDQDFARFVDYAMGSASEVEYHLLLARDLSLLDATTYAALHGRTTEVKRMLASFLASLRADR
jgi:four helix bundle protein